MPSVEKRSVAVRAIAATPGRARRVASSSARSGQRADPCRRGDQMQDVGAPDERSPSMTEAADGVAGPCQTADECRGQDHQRGSSQRFSATASDQQEQARSVAARSTRNNQAHQPVVAEIRVAPARSRARPATTRRQRLPAHRLPRSEPATPRPRSRLTTRLIHAIDRSRVAKARRRASSPRVAAMPARR